MFVRGKVEATVFLAFFFRDRIQIKVTPNNFYNQEQKRKEQVGECMSLDFRGNEDEQVNQK